MHAFVLDLPTAIIIPLIVWVICIFVSFFLLLAYWYINEISNNS